VLIKTLSWIQVRNVPLFLDKILCSGSQVGNSVWRLT